MPAPRLAKLTRPRTEGLAVRARLFEALDEARSRPVVWVSAPPGAGKTSLVSGYVEARALPCLWYQCDGADADPASFFYYLGLAAAEHGGKKAPGLPLFTEEYAQELAGFARRFFRLLFARLPAGAVLVLDNYQDAGAAAGFHEAVAVAAEELPEGSGMLVASRGEPPGALSRARASRRVSQLGWEQLKLTALETAAVAAGACADEATLAQVQAHSGGWAAGVVLMAERIRQSGGLKAGQEAPETLETIFEYFAAQVFGAMQAQEQGLLLKLAQLPRLTEHSARALTGEPEAVRVLEGLAKRNLFVERRAQGEQRGYEFHALFRAFLRAQARERLGAAELGRAAHSAAALLQAGGQAEEAFGLYAEHGAWEAAAALIKAEAPGLVRQGRRETISRWIEALPQVVCASDGLLLYWQGVARFPSASNEALRVLERAFETFGVAGDPRGQLLAADAILDVLLAHTGDLCALDGWCERTAALLDRPESSEDSELHAHALSRLCRSLYHRAPLSGEFRRRCDQARRMVGTEVATETRLYAAALLIITHWSWGEAASNDRLISELSPLARSSDVADGAARLFDYACRYHWLALLDFDPAATGELDARAEVMDESGFGPIHLDFLRVKAHYLTAKRDFSGALHVLKHQIGRDNHRIRTAMRPGFYSGLALCALAAGQREHIPGYVRECVAVLDLGSVPALLSHGNVLAQLLGAAGRIGEARSLLDTVAAIGGVEDYPWISGRIELARAYLALLEGDLANAQRHLGTSLASLKTVRYRHWIVFPDPDFDRLFALALEHGIETEFVTSLIREHGIPAPDADLDAWPWPLRLRILGGFTLEGLPAKGGKPPRKLDEMLVLLALGGPGGVSQEWLADALWPDAEGDAGANALQVTLYRLRKRLGREDAVRVQGGMVTLDRTLCWVDAWAFESKAAQAQRDGAGTGTADLALALYRGHVLEGEGEVPGVGTVREKLRRHWQALVLARAEALGTSGRVEEQVLLLEGALDRDPVAEAVARALMRAYGTRGEAAKVAEVYERCLRALSERLGVAPSAETERLRRDAVPATR